MEKENKNQEKKKFEKIGERNPFANQFKILWHMDRLCSFWNDGTTFPVHIEINPTNVCNKACEWCITDYLWSEEYLDIDIMNRFLEEFSELGGKAIGWSGGGEPTCHPKLGEAVRKASETGLKQGLFTNGVFSNELVDTLGKNMEWIRFSIDTADKRKWREKMHIAGSALDKVWENINKLKHYPARIVTNANVTKWNSDDMKKLARISKEKGADGFQIRPILPRPYKNDEFDKEFYSNYFDKLKEIEKLETSDFQIFISWDKFKDITTGDIGNRNYDKCQYHHFFSVLNANGDLGVCMYRLDDDNFIFGNIYERSLEEIWNNEKRKTVIKYCNNNINFDQCQICCKGHELNKFLHFIQNPIKESDPEFF